MVSRSPLRSIGRLALIFFCLGLVLILALFILPIYLDISAFKGPVEEILTEVIEAPVTIGEVHLDPSLWPTLRISEVSVEGTGWEDAPVFTHVEKAEIQISLLALLRRELRVKGLAASNLDFHVQRPEGEPGNWPVWTTLSYDITELSDIEFENVTIFLDDHDIGQADAAIERLELDVAENRPLDLELRGSLEGLPFSLTTAGPTLADLSPRASSFPLSVGLELADLRVGLSGSASRTPSGSQALLDVEAESADLAFLRMLEEVNLPQFGGFNLTSQVSIRTSKLRLSEIRGEIGPTFVSGDLSLQTTDNRPRISGKVSLGLIDLQPWIDHFSESRIGEPQPLPFELLNAFDAGIELKIQKIRGLEAEIDALATSIDLSDGNLAIPLQLQLASVALIAELGVHYSSERPEILAKVDAQDVEVEQLRTLVDLPDHLHGAIGQMRATASTSGLLTDELVTNLVALIEAGDVNLIFANEDTEKPFEIDFERIRIDYRAKSPLTLSTNGTFLEEDFRLDLETGLLASLADTDIWPIHVALKGSGATIDLDGEVVIQEEGFDIDIEFLLAGDRLADLEAWFGVSPDADLAYRLEGRLKTEGEKRSLQMSESAIGRTLLMGTFAWDLDSEEVPLAADLHAPTVDLQELQGLFDPITDLDTEQRVVGLDVPILPAGISFGDADIDLLVDRLHREPVDLTDIQAAFRFRQGQLERSPFSFHYDSTVFDGELWLDLRDETARFSLDLSGSAEALGAILHQEKLVTDAGFTAQQLELSIIAEGATVRQIVESADITAKLTEVRWPISLPDSEWTLDLQLGELSLTGPKGEPIILESAGFLDGQPIHLRTAIRLTKNSQTAHELSAPFRLQAEIASTQVEVDGEFSLPITKGELDLNLIVSGESLSALSSLAQRELPDLGPYRLEGRLAVKEALYALQDFDLTLGESDLKGSVDYRQIENRPTLSAKLLSQRTRSMDYLPPTQPADSEDDGAPARQRSRANFAAAKLSLDLLKEFDAKIDLEIRELDTGGSPIAHVAASLELDRGHLLLSARRPQSGDEVALISARVEPLDRGIDADLRAQWRRQPYGLLANMINPGTPEGSWSVDLALQAQGASFEELLQSLGGHIDFTEYPEDLNATILDLWGGGLLGSLLPVFSLSDQSQINCLVGRFVVEEGVMKPELLALDATRSRVKMRGYIDLPNNHLKLRLNPRPKTRSLINLATPVKLRGPLDDPSVRFTTSGIAVTAFRFSLWVYTVWVDLLRRPLPRDGSDICLDPESRTP